MTTTADLKSLEERLVEVLATSRGESVSALGAEELGWLHEDARAVINFLAAQAKPAEPEIVQRARRIVAATENTSLRDQPSQWAGRRQALDTIMAYEAGLVARPTPSTSSPTTDKPKRGIGWFP